MSIMGVIGTIVIGFIAGLIARMLHPGDDKLGFWMTAILGVAGSALAGLIGHFAGWYKNGEAGGFIASVIGAIILLVIYSRVKAANASSGAPKQG